MIFHNILTDLNINDAIINIFFEHNTFEAYIPLEKYHCDLYVMSDFSLKAEPSS